MKTHPMPPYAAPLPANEEFRLRVLKELKLLDSAPDQCLQAMVELAASATQSPIALISLLDDDRQWFKASVGLAEKQTPRCQAFCGFTILQNTPFVVRDTLKHPTLKDNPLVTGKPFIRAYLGLPIVVRGANIGTLCVIDTKIRSYGLMRSNSLARIVRMIEEHIVLRDKQ